MTCKPKPNTYTLPSLIMMKLVLDSLPTESNYKKYRQYIKF